MTYGQFLLVFLAVPIAVLLMVLVRRGPGRPRRQLLWQLPLLAALAVVYTGPWDGSLITQGVWSYASAQVSGATVLRVPIEEYGFYVLQVVLTGLLTAILWTGRSGREGRRWGG